MKNYQSYVNFLLICLFMTLLVNSCTRDKEDIVERSYNSSDEDLSAKLYNFTNLARELKHGKRLKSEQHVTVEEALDYIGNALNYEFCFPHSQFIQLQEYNVTIEIPVNNYSKNISLADVALGYNDAIEGIKMKSLEIADDNKKLICCNIKFVSIDDKCLTCNVVAYIGVGYLKFITSYFPYNIQQQYYYLDYGGNCSDINNIEPGYGASDILQRDLRSNTIPIILPGYRIYYEIDPISPQILEPRNYRSDPQDIIDNKMDYKIYYAREGVGAITPTVLCLGMEGNTHEMNFYYDGTRTAISSFLSNINKDLITIDIEGTNRWSTSFQSLEYLHLVKVHFGIVRIERINGLPHDITL